MLLSDKVVRLSDTFGKHWKGKSVLDEGKNQVTVMAYLNSNKMLFCSFGMPDIFHRSKK